DLGSERPAGAREHPLTGTPGSGIATLLGDAQHAQSPPFARQTGNQLELREHLFDLGSAFRHLHGAGGLEGAALRTRRATGDESINTCFTEGPVLRAENPR